MTFDNFDRVIEEAVRDETGLNAEDVATCLADISAALDVLDDKLSSLLGFMPEPIVREVKSCDAFDFFFAARAMKLHAATMRGIGAASMADATNPYATWQTMERGAWDQAYDAGRKLVEA